MPKYNLIENGTVYDTVECESIHGALALADDSNDNSCYGDEHLRTFFVKRYAVNVDDPNDKDWVKVKIDPTPPKCEPGHKHNWKQPHNIVGGLKENPGVFGSAGGVMIHEVCLNCGCGKKTDTWGTDLSDGSQGHEIVEYLPDEYCDLLREMNEVAKED